MNTKRVSGSVKWFNEAKGFGFLSTPALMNGDREIDIFVHYSAVMNEGYKNLIEGWSIEFDLVTGPKGPQAFNVVRLAEEVVA